MKWILVGLLGLLLCAGCAGCQPTPEQEIVVKKDAERMIEQASSEDNGTLLDSLVIPNGRYSYESTGADGRLHIKVDASIEAPACNNIPIFRVSIGEFSQEVVTDIFNYFFPDEKPYDRVTVQTKLSILVVQPPPSTFMANISRSPPSGILKLYVMV